MTNHLQDSPFDKAGLRINSVTIPCLYLHFISSLLAIHFLFSSNPLLAFLLLSTSLYYSAFLLFSLILPLVPTIFK